MPVIFFILLLYNIINTNNNFLVFGPFWKVFTLNNSKSLGSPLLIPLHLIAGQMQRVQNSHRYVTEDWSLKCCVCVYVYMCIPQLFMCNHLDRSSMNSEDPAIGWKANDWRLKTDGKALFAHIRPVTIRWFFPPFFYKRRATHPQIAYRSIDHRLLIYLCMKSVIVLNGAEWVD